MSYIPQTVPRARNRNTAVNKIYSKNIFLIIYYVDDPESLVITNIKSGLGRIYTNPMANQGNVFLK